MSTIIFDLLQQGHDDETDWESELFSTFSGSVIPLDLLHAARPRETQ
jgi:hypothetical protein